MYCETCRIYLGWFDAPLSHVFCSYAYCVAYCEEHCPREMDGQECDYHDDDEDEVENG
jgi:hypothetical protein